MKYVRARAEAGEGNFTWGGTDAAFFLLGFFVGRAVCFFALKYFSRQVSQTRYHELPPTPPSPQFPAHPTQKFPPEL